MQYAERMEYSEHSRSSFQHGGRKEEVTAQYKYLHADDGEASGNLNSFDVLFRSLIFHFPIYNSAIGRKGEVEEKGKNKNSILRQKTKQKLASDGINKQWHLNKHKRFPGE